MGSEWDSRSDCSGGLEWIQGGDKWVQVQPLYMCASRCLSEGCWRYAREDRDTKVERGARDLLGR